MSKRNIAYVIGLNPENKSKVFAYSNNLCNAVVFSTREKARESKRIFGGLGVEIIWQVALDCSGRPVSIIKKVR